ncbi:polyhydroxyalkanoate depolymerase [Methylocapsa aurea]|uniref:polyhydroxyalkanoate depolymerase n=1 Tax=Methylocapsa aurea TaxID=663610 RepID=UPI000567AECF|nr:polyhydroxyalkanoate depolymerase [Methylocapsa aurea]
MIYQAYGAQADFLDLVRPLAAAAGTALRLPWPLLAPGWPIRNLAGALDTFANLTVTHARLPFAIDSARVGDRLVPVREEPVHSTPFATLLHFKKDLETAQPRVLVVAPLSGHFATLLRATVKTMLADHDVYITDWGNIRDAPLAEGRFDFNSFVDHVIEFLRVMGPGAHVVAVCQPCVPVLAAAALMAEDRDEAQPRSMTLMAGPVDTRVNPTKVNELAAKRPISWFEQNLTAKVPRRFKGAGRRVYPGFMQLAAFISMNLERHLRSFKDMAEARADGDLTKLQVLQTFYEEYFAVMDLPAEFYLETVKMVFQDHVLPLGKLEVHGRRVDPRAIKRTALLTVEGERDDICGLGQTLAAQELCSGLRQYMKAHHVQTGVGHYGVFNGRRWNTEIYPKLRDMIQMTS